MTKRLPLPLSGLAAATLIVPLVLAGCAAPVREARPESFDASTELAIDCRHDAALAALDKTDARRGGSTRVSELQRVILLRDAGRALDAERVLRERNARADVSADDAVYSGNAIVEGLDAIHAERTARSGQAHCG